MKTQYIIYLFVLANAFAACREKDAKADAYGNFEAGKVMDSPEAHHQITTPGIPCASTVLQSDSSHGRSGVEPRTFTTRLPDRLRALYAQ